MIVSVIVHKTQYKFKERIFRKISESTGIEIQSQHWVGYRQLSMEGVSIEYFPNSIDPGR